MKRSPLIGFLAVALAAAGGAALLAVFQNRNGAVAPLQNRPAEARVAWRVAVSARDERPCPVADGWVVADAAGNVAKVAAGGRVLWRVAFSNEAFAGAAEAAGGRVVMASDSGRAFGLDGATGATLWRRETDARFRQAPLTGIRDGESVVWLVSQEDGRLFCLRASDGGVVWKTEATNRCDGEPAASKGRLAYGNCDGAVYLFSAADGQPLGSVAVGEEDQMAGGILTLKDGRLVTGTRQGNLAVINPETRACEAKVKVSEGEAFVTPVLLAGGEIAMGSDEGRVTLWRREGQSLAPAGLFEAGASVRSLAALGDTLFAFAGGTLFVMDSRGRLRQQLPLGDSAGRLAVNGAGEVACVVDGALVCVKGGAR